MKIDFKVIRVFFFYNEAIIKQMLFQFWNIRVVSLVGFKKDL